MPKELINAILKIWYAEGGDFWEIAKTRFHYAPTYWPGDLVFSTSNVSFFGEVLTTFFWVEQNKFYAVIQTNSGTLMIRPEDTLQKQKRLPAPVLSRL